jgi:hypothetical protein
LHDIVPQLPFGPIGWFLGFGFDLPGAALGNNQILCLGNIPENIAGSILPQILADGLRRLYDPVSRRHRPDRHCVQLRLANKLDEVSLLVVHHFITPSLPEGESFPRMGPIIGLAAKNLFDDGVIHIDLTHRNPVRLYML